MFLGGVPVAVYLPTVVGCMMAAGLIVLAWMFKPEIDRFIQPKAPRVYKHIEVEGHAGIDASASVEAKRPKTNWRGKNWEKIVRLVAVGGIGSVTLVYTGWKTYTLIPSPIPAGAFLAIIMLVAGGVFLAMLSTYYTIEVLKA